MVGRVDVRHVVPGRAELLEAQEEFRSVVSGHSGLLEARVVDRLEPVAEKPVDD